MYRDTRGNILPTPRPTLCYLSTCIVLPSTLPCIYPAQCHNNTWSLHCSFPDRYPISHTAHTIPLLHPALAALYMCNTLSHKSDNMCTNTTMNICAQIQHVAFVTICSPLWRKYHTYPWRGINTTLHRYHRMENCGAKNTAAATPPFIHRVFLVKPSEHIVNCDTRCNCAVLCNNDNMFTLCNLARGASYQGCMFSETHIAEYTGGFFRWSHVNICASGCALTNKRTQGFLADSLTCCWRGLSGLRSCLRSGDNGAYPLGGGFGRTVSPNTSVHICSLALDLFGLLWYSWASP